MSKERLNYIFCLLLISVAALDFQRGPDTAAAFWGIAAITATVLTVSKSVERILEEQEGNTANFPGIYHFTTRKKRENAAMLFLEFKSIHPRNTEPYNPTPENIERWRWHVDQNLHRKRVLGSAHRWQQPENAEFADLIERRRVRTWDDFDVLTKAVYTGIARCFIGPVFACGSRVRGDYIEPNDPPHVAAWRKEAGKAEKTVSDFDIFVPKDTVHALPIPEYVDIIRHGIPENEKILIPVQAWDFEKLPPEEHARVIDLARAGQWKELVEVHDRYELSPYTYCCDIDGLKAWYRWAIENGKIKAT